MKNTALRSTVRIILFYALFGALWIIGSDFFVALFVKEPRQILVIEAYKGLTFVFASTLFLYLVTIRELRLREQETRRAQMYLDVAGVIIVLINVDERVALINKKGKELLGLKEEEIIGRNWFDSFVPPAERTAAREVFAKIISGSLRPFESCKSSIQTSDGNIRLIEWNHSPIRDEAGRITAVLCSGEDVTVRTRTEEQARMRLEHLSTLHAIDMIISSNLDLRTTLSQIIELVISQFSADAADVLLLDRHTQILEHAASHGFRTEIIRRTRLRLGEGIAGLAALEHRSISVPDLRTPDTSFVRTELIENEGFIAYYAVPLFAKGQVKGVLELMHRTPLFLDKEQQDFLEALAAQAAIAIDNATLFEELQRSNIELTLAYDATLEGWARALDLRDQVTEQHTERVTEMTVRLARAMGLSEQEIVHIRRGALLHDIGKIGIPDSILKKQGPLSPEEWEIMRRHPVYAFEMLRHIAYLRPALDIPYCHHERWDGTGYPRGLKGEQIPLAARIFALADVLDALFAKDRPYRTPITVEDACKHIRGLSGTHLDPKVVEVFLSISDQFCAFIPDRKETA